MLFGLKPTWWVIILAVIMMGILTGLETVKVDQFVEFTKWALGFGAAKSGLVEGAIALKGKVK